ncbi:MAG TPA: AAA family ATPase [Planctomycetaceae bacterium]|nr:AAA family ATPase [Planctomycetaceae bacterium]HQZ68250.1 AAA family ATPase [Planctomycetaceae bacterium]
MIREIRIRNFKSIRDVCVKLTPVTVLVGRSGTGKSNFVFAVRFLRDILNGHTGQLQKTWPSTKSAPPTDAATCFDVKFDVAGVDGEYCYSLSLSSTGPGTPLEKERLSLGDKVLFLQESGERRNTVTWTVEPAVVEVPKAGPVALGRIPSLGEVVIAFAALSEGIACYTFHNDVLNLGQVNSHAHSGLNDTASNYLSTMKDIVTNLQDLSSRKSIISALRRVNEDVSSVELNDLRNPAHAVVGHQFNGRTLGLNLAQESEGFRRFFAHLLALYQRPPKQLLMFEHPEDGIHPGALSLLAEEFLAAPDDGRGQVILTTHSPGLLDHFSPDQIRVVEREEFCTKIGPVSAEQKEALREQLMTPGELLTVDPARLDASAAGVSQG